MKITILAVGTRGDVQPYIALGQGLRAAGHEVWVAAASNFEGFVREFGLHYARLDASFRDLLQSDALQQAMTSRNPIQRQREVLRMVHHSLELFAAGTWEVCQGADAIIYSTIAVTAYSVAEKLGVPCFWAPLMPVTRTRFFPSLTTPLGNGRSGLLNWLSHLIEEQAAWQPARSFVNQWRRQTLNLKPFPFWGPYGLLEERRLPVLYGFSAHVVPRPADWSERIHVTGYWFLDSLDGWQPPDGLVDFIEAGPPPVYIGFGSMFSRDAEATTRIVVEALRRCGQRAVLATGWDSLGGVELPETVFQIDSAPHDWLFPRMAAVVHHGGAGTTAAGLRAGVPSVIVPFAADQPFWAQRVYELGAGVRPVPHQKLSAERLAEAVSAAVSSSQLRRRAAAIGERIREENGVARAVEIVQDVVCSNAGENGQRVWDRAILPQRT